MRKYLLQKKWFRNLFSDKTFILVNFHWKDYTDFKLGEKITSVDGRWNTQTFCKCGNELVHSRSYTGIRAEAISGVVYSYKCSCCGFVSYRRPDLIPGLLSCDKQGKPINI